MSPTLIALLSKIGLECVSRYMAARAARKENGAEPASRCGCWGAPGPKPVAA